MRKEAAKRFTRLLLVDILRRNRSAIGLCLLVLVCFVLWAGTKHVTSRQTLEGKFVRWTTQQSHSGQGQLRIFVDLPDGRTIGAAAWQGWQPQEPGSPIGLEESVLFWGGKSYRILP